MKWLFLLLLPLGAMAQVPGTLNFQTLVRDQEGKPLPGQDISIRVNILSGGENGITVYAEEHQVETNHYGLANLMIGTGEVINGLFDEIAWEEGDLFLLVEMDPEGGNNYTLYSLQPFQAVPYAINAQKTNLKAGEGIVIQENEITARDNSETNELQTLSLSGNSLILSKNGGEVDLPDSGDNWGSQWVLTSPVFTGNGTSTSPLDIRENGIRSSHVMDGTITEQDLVAGLIRVYSAGQGINIHNNIIENTGDVDNTNEIQSLSLSNNTLTLSKGGGSVILPSGSTGDNWGNQVVITSSSLKGDGTAARPLDLENQSVRSAHIQNGTILKEDMAPGVITDYTGGSGISVQNGIIQNTGDLSESNEIQNLSYDESQRKLSISNGNTIQFPALNLSDISDTDGNTSVDVEKTVNDDKIRFALAGDEFWVFQKNAAGTPMIQFSNPKGGLFIGQDAGVNNMFVSDITKGFGNSFVGHLSGVYNTTGNNNSGFGHYTLWGNKTGSQNVAVGFEALLLGEKGQANVAIGHRAMQNFITGDRNIAVGRYALGIINGGNNNIAIGDNAQAFARNRSYTIAIGDSTLYWNGNGVEDMFKAIDNMAIGSKSMYSNTMGSENLAIGNQTLFNNISGDRNTTVGLASMYSNMSGHSNTGLGFHALFANEAGSSNVAVGTNSLSANYSGEGNVAVGSTAMFGNMDGNVNTAVGTGALFSNNSGSYNVAVGYNSLSANSTGIHNVAVGNDALSANDQGIYNTAVGGFSMYDNISGYSVTAVGYQAGATGNQNQYCTYVGEQAKNSTGASYINSTAIGANSRITANNQVRIGDANTTSIGGYRAWSNLSDARFKQNIREDVKGLEFILKLRPVTYEIDVAALEKATGIPSRSESAGEHMTKVLPNRQTGFIAQEVDAAGRDIQYQFSGVDKPQNDQDFYGLRYAEFVVPLVKAVQEQQKMIQEQQKLIELLLERVRTLEQVVTTEPEGQE